MLRIFTAFKSFFEPLLLGKYWKFLVVAISLLYSVATSMPKYENLFESSLTQEPYYEMYFTNYKALSDQVDHPFQPILLDIASHSSKISFRFVPALLVKYFPVKDVWGRAFVFYFLNNLAGVVCFFSLLTLTFRYSGNKLFSALVTFNFAVLYFGKSFFHDTCLWNDGIAFAFLLLSLLSRNSIVTLLCLTAAYFTDERAIFAGVLIFVFQKLTDPATTYSGKFPFISLSARDIPFVASFFCYAVIRLVLTKFLGMGTPIGYDSGVSFLLRLRKGYPIKLNVLALGMIFKFAWIPVIWSFWQMRSKVMLLLASLFGLLSLIVIGLSVEDITRSIIYSFMVLFSAFYIYHRKAADFRITDPSYGAFALLIINFCTPTVAVISNFIDIIPYYTLFV